MALASPSEPGATRAWYATWAIAPFPESAGAIRSKRRPGFSWFGPPGGKRCGATSTTPAPATNETLSASPICSEACGAPSPAKAPEATISAPLVPWGTAVWVASTSRLLATPTSPANLNSMGWAAPSVKRVPGAGFSALTTGGRSGTSVRTRLASETLPVPSVACAVKVICGAPASRLGSSTGIVTCADNVTSGLAVSCGLSVWPTPLTVSCRSATTPSSVAWTVTVRVEPETTLC